MTDYWTHQQIVQMFHSVWDRQGGVASLLAIYSTSLEKLELMEENNVDVGRTSQR